MSFEFLMFFSMQNKKVEKKTVEELHHFRDAINFKC